MLSTFHDIKWLGLCWSNNALKSLTRGLENKQTEKAFYMDMIKISIYLSIYRYISVYLSICLSVCLCLFVMVLAVSGALCWLSLADGQTALAGPWHGDTSKEHSAVSYDVSLSLLSSPQHWNTSHQRTCVLFPTQWKSQASTLSPTGLTTLEGWQNYCSFPPENRNSSFPLYFLKLFRDSSSLCQSRRVH